jgi:hypothetical protein
MSSLRALTDDQLTELKLVASRLPRALRGDLLRLIVGYLQLEGDEASDPAFARAVNFALSALPHAVAC